MRSPLDSLGHHRAATAGVVLALAASMWLVAAVGVAVFQIQQGASTWWASFSPVVYLEGGADSEEVERLRTEIEGWSEVSTVTVEGPQKMMARLKEEFGAEEVEAMGVEASMMPTALVVTPRLWRPKEVELVARLEAMEVRRSVVEVEAPAPGALDWMERGRSVAAGVLIAAAISLMASLIGFSSFLRHLQYRHRRENHLLEVFGASRWALRRPTLIRSLVLGTTAGAVAAIGFLPWVLTVDGFVEEVVGAGAMTATEMALWSVALVALGSGLGAALGWRCSRPHDVGTGAVMESLLEWENEKA